MKILVVDDEMEWVETLVERLALRDITARGERSGTAALERLRQEPFDVVLLDVKMPGMNGLQVLEQIREERPDQKVVLLTGHGSRHDADEGLRLGADSYLMKPVKIDDLISILKNAMGDEVSDAQQ